MGIGLADGEDPAEDDAAAGQDPPLLGGDDVPHVHAGGAPVGEEGPVDPLDHLLATGEKPKPVRAPTIAPFSGRRKEEEGGAADRQRRRESAVLEPLVVVDLEKGRPRHAELPPAAREVSVPAEGARASGPHRHGEEEEQQQG